MQRWLEDMGILKARSTSSDPIVVKDFFRFADQHIDRVSRYAHMASPIRTALMLMGHPQLRPILDARLGTQWTTEIEQRLAAVSGVDSNLRNVENWTLRKFVGNYAVATLWGRPTTMILQKLGLVTAAADAGSWREAAAILAKVPRLNVLNRTLFAEMTRHSGYLRDRYGEGSARLVDPTKYTGIFGSRPSNAFVASYRKYQQAGMKPMEYLDQDVAIGVYAAAKARIKKTFPHMTELQVQEAAARETALTIRRTANATSALDHTGQGLLGHQNAFAAMWTLFASAAMKMGNQVEEAALELYHHPSRANAARLSRAVLGLLASAVLAAIIREIYRRFTRGFQDEKQPKTLDQLGIAALADVADTFVLGGSDVVRLLNATLQGKPLEFARPNSFFELATDIIEPVRALMARKDETTASSVPDRAELVPKVERAVFAVMKLAGAGGEAVYTAGKGAVRLFGQPKGEPWSVYAAISRRSKDDAVERVYDYLERNKDNPRVATNLIEGVQTRVRGGRSEKEYTLYVRGLSPADRDKERDRYRAEWSLFGEAVREARGRQAASRVGPSPK